MKACEQTRPSALKRPTATEWLTPSEAAQHIKVKPRNAPALGQTREGERLQTLGYEAPRLAISAGLMSMSKPRVTGEGQPNDSVFRAAAKVSAEWMGAGIQRNSPPFDVDEFLRLCGEEGDKG